MSMVFAALIMLGQLIFAIGMTMSDVSSGWYVMFVGRTVFGFGGESLSVAMSAMIAQWFTGKELAMALGVNLALARVGSVINDLASQAIAEKWPIYWALWAGLGVCVISFGATVWGYYIDVNAVSVLAKNKLSLIMSGAMARPTRKAKAPDAVAGSLNTDKAGSYQSPAFKPAPAPASSASGSTALLQGESTPTLTSSLPQGLTDMASDSPGTLRLGPAAMGGSRGADVALPSLGPGATHSETTTTHTGFEESPAMGAREGSGYAALKAEGDGAPLSEEELIAQLNEVESEVVRCSDVMAFPMTFWIITLSCLTVYCAVLPFNNIAANFIATKWLLPEAGDPTTDAGKNKVFAKANQIMLITYLTAGFLSPFMGALIDRIGLRAVLNVLAAVLIVMVHFVLGYTDMYPIAPLVVLGICYSIYAAALWPSIALVVKPEFQGTAYGVVTAVQNAGLALAPLVISTLMPPTNCNGSYKCVETFFISLGAVGVVTGLALNLADWWAPVAVLNLTDKAATAKKKELGLLTAEELAAEVAREAAEAQQDGKAETTGLLAAARSSSVDASASSAV